MLLTVVAFVVALGVLIAVHEWGHYRVAVACGVKVLRYSIGFGKPLLRWTSKKSGTEYVIAALPLGGYVRMLDEREGEVKPEEKHLAFNTQPLRSRAAIVAAGPIANLVLAVAILTVVNWIGMSEPAARLAAPPAGSVLQVAGVHGGDWVQRVSRGGKDWEPVRALGDLRWTLTTAAIEGETLQLEVASRQEGTPRVVSLDLTRLQQKEPDAAFMEQAGLVGAWTRPVLEDVVAGVHGGDWVQRVSRGGKDWEPVRALGDLRWTLTTAAIEGETLQLEVASRQEGTPRVVSLDLTRLQQKEPDAAFMEQAGLVGAWTRPVLEDVVAGGPADKAGLRKGDFVSSFNGQVVTDGTQLLMLIRVSGASGQAADQAWVVVRDGKEMRLTVQPDIVPGKDGKPSVARINAYIGGQPDMVLVRRGPWDGFAAGVQKTWELSSMTLRMMGRMLIGQASLKNISGPLTIADYAGKSASMGLIQYLSFLALISISLGVLNLLPLPVLDGGHLMYYLWEGITGRSVSDVWAERFQRAGVAVILMMMSIAFFNDISRLLG